MEGIYLPPDARTLMESTRALGYTLGSAIADLLDNSISKDAKIIDIQYRPTVSPYLYILDDGSGMSPIELTKAMRYGSQDPNEIRAQDDMGRFGLGLKTASLSQCRCLSVISKKDNVISGRRWDLDSVTDWNLLIVDGDYLESMPGYNDLLLYDHGTLVVWQKLDRLLEGNQSTESIFSSKMKDVRDHISMVFHRFILGETGLKRVLISINKIPVESADPFLIGRSEQLMDIEPIYINDEKITVIPYILPHLSRLSIEEINQLGGEDGLRKKQGFYIYRNKRLLIWGTWFKLLRQEDCYKLARVKIDIPNSLDHQWTLDIRKSTAIPPEAVKKNLNKIVKKIADGSKRTYTFRGRKETNEEIEHVWRRTETRDGVRYFINKDHPLINALYSNIGVEKHAILEQFLKLIESALQLNSLFMDFSGDQNFNQVQISEEEAYLQMKEIIDMSDGNDIFIEAKLNQLYKTEPYSLMPYLIDRLKSEVIGNV